MLRILRARLIQAIAILIIVSLGTTLLMNAIPGSAASLVYGPDASEAAVAQFNRNYGYNRPVLVQYWSWLSHAIRGNLGIAIQAQEPVVHLVTQALPVTLELAILSFVLVVLLAVPLATWAASHEGGRVDRAVTGLSSGLLAVPSYVSCVLLLLILSVKANLLPPNGWVSLGQSVGQNLRFVALPVLTLVLAILPLFVRVLRGDMVSVLREEFVHAARARGLREGYILFRHVLRPASLSLFTVSGLVFGYLFGGSVVVESFFSIPGLGNLAVTSVSGKDIPVVQGLVVFVALGYLVVNTLVDLSLALLDPRVRASRGSPGA